MIFNSTASDAAVSESESDSADADAAETGASVETGASAETGAPVGGDTGTDSDGEPSPDLPTAPNEENPPPDPEGCHEIYAQDNLPTFELELEPVVWEQLQQEWLDGPMNEEEDIDTKVYHPVTQFKYGEVEIYDAQIRLRGNATYWYPDDKMQFQIGFHTNNPDGNFLGLERVLLDAATFNENMLRERLAYAVMRDVGIKAPCANNARLVVNGEYYGIFTNLEKIDEPFLDRNFDDPSGDLWKRANWTIKTNEDTTNEDRIDAMRDADNIEELFTYLDVEQALRVFAAEAVVPDSDGMWAGGLNFYIYDEPIGGKFMLLPWDMDSSFDRFNDPPNGAYPEDPDPVVWEKQTSHGRPWYDIMLEDPTWFWRYIELIDEIVHDGYTPDKMHERIDTWTAQIQDAVFEDVNKPFSNEHYLDEVDDLHDFVQHRYEFLDEWLVCWLEGGIDDGDGYCEDP